MKMGSVSVQGEQKNPMRLVQCHTVPYSSVKIINLKGTNGTKVERNMILELVQSTIELTRGFRIQQGQHFTLPQIVCTDPEGSLNV